MKCVLFSKLKITTKLLQFMALNKKALMADIKKVLMSFKENFFFHLVYFFSHNNSLSIDKRKRGFLLFLKHMKYFFNSQNYVNFTILL